MIRKIILLILATSYMVASSCNIDNNSNLNQYSTSNNNTGMASMPNNLNQNEVLELKKLLNSHLEIAKEEKKPHIVIIAKESCPYANQLLEGILSNKKFKNVLRQNFVLTIIESSYIPAFPEFYTDNSPTLFFLDYQGFFFTDAYNGMPKSLDDFSLYLEKMKDYHNNILIPSLEKGEGN
jgi:hypothetical protein